MRVYRCSDILNAMQELRKWLSKMSGSYGVKLEAYLHAIRYPPYSLIAIPIQKINVSTWEVKGKDRKERKKQRTLEVIGYGEMYEMCVWLVIWNYPSNPWCMWKRYSYSIYVHLQYFYGNLQAFHSESENSRKLILEMHSPLCRTPLAIIWNEKKRWHRCKHARTQHTWRVGYSKPCADAKIECST